MKLVFDQKGTFEAMYAAQRWCKDKVRPRVGLIKWLMNGERGSSSNAMCGYIFGMPWLNENATPSDPADFRRCRLFVQETDCRDCIDQMREVSPALNAIIEHWDELCETMDSEVKWMSGDKSGKAEKTYALMQEILDGARATPKMKA
jgi:hypothetical protein